MSTQDASAVSIFEVWKKALGNKAFAWKILLAPVVFFLYSLLTQKLGTYIELRHGIRLEDKFLALFPASDFSMHIFLLLYCSLALAIVAHLRQPDIVMQVIEMHFVVAVVRQICIMLVALEPPAHFIALKDVFIENTFYPSNMPLTKDLFFSGHVASIWIYFLCSRNVYLKSYQLLATVLMAYMVLCMRIHYTYDVYGAILFTTLTYHFRMKYYRYLQRPKGMAHNIGEANIPIYAYPDKTEKQKSTDIPHS